MDGDLQNIFTSAVSSMGDGVIGVLIVVVPLGLTVLLSIWGVLWGVNFFFGTSGMGGRSMSKEGANLSAKFAEFNTDQMRYAAYDKKKYDSSGIATSSSLPGPGLMRDPMAQSKSLSNTTAGYSDVDKFFAGKK